MRADRLLTLAHAHLAPRFLNVNRAHQIPILMYHGIRRDLGARHPYFETNTAPEVFAAQMDSLHQNGYRTVSLEEALQCVDGNTDTRKRVVITFDDGYLDFFTEAFPILLRHRFTATMFVVSGFPDQSSPRLPNKEFMSWSQIRTIQSQGIDIGSHTVNHPKLWELDRSEVQHELTHSKQTIEDKIGQPIRSFACPYAFPEQNKNFTRTLEELLDEAGYEVAVSTIIGTVEAKHSRFCLPRIPINSHDDSRLFRAKIDGAYNWLHSAQRVYKSLVGAPARFKVTAGYNLKRSNS